MAISHCTAVKCLYVNWYPSHFLHCLHHSSLTRLCRPLLKQLTVLTVLPTRPPHLAAHRLVRTQPSSTNQHEVNQTYMHNACWKGDCSHTEQMKINEKELQTKITQKWRRSQVTVTVTYRLTHKPHHWPLQVNKVPNILQGKVATLSMPGKVLNNDFITHSFMCITEKEVWKSFHKVMESANMPVWAPPGKYDWIWDSFGPPESTTQTANQSVQQFLHSLWQWAPLSPKIVPSHGGSGPI